MCLQIAALCGIVPLGGHGIAGLIDAEAHFVISELNGGRSVSCRMVVAMRDDDVALLTGIARMTGVGVVRHPGDGRASFVRELLRLPASSARRRAVLGQANDRIVGRGPQLARQRAGCFQKPVGNLQGRAMTRPLRCSPTLHAAHHVASTVRQVQFGERPHRVLRPPRPPRAGRRGR